MKENPTKNDWIYFKQAKRESNRDKYVSCECLKSAFWTEIQIGFFIIYFLVENFQFSTSY